MVDILHLLTTRSTNEDAYNLAQKGAAHGFSVLADTQTAGRGRLDRVWESPAGTGLYCSIVVRPDLAFTSFPQISLTAGLAVCKTFESLIEASFGLKWPNDIHCNGKKCAGILVKSSPYQLEGQSPFLIVGIGVNVNTTRNSFPESLQPTVTSFFEETRQHYDVHRIFTAIRISLLEHIQLHETRGFQSILKQWKKRDVLLGKEMEWLTPSKEIVTGTGIGIDDTGQLIIKDRKGNSHTVLSGDVSLAGTGK